MLLTKASPVSRVLKATPDPQGMLPMSVYGASVMIRLWTAMLKQLSAATVEEIQPETTVSDVWMDSTAIPPVGSHVYHAIARWPTIALVQRAS